MVLKPDPYRFHKAYALLVLLMAVAIRLSSMLSGLLSLPDYFGMTSEQLIGSQQVDAK